jgi:anti-sigma-K factor RskA
LLPGAGKQSSRDALTLSSVRRTQPVAELLKAEESSEAALSMINKERERHEIESLLPWHAAGTLDRRDAERVERALAEDGELAQRYELVREELAETIRLNEMLGAPSARAMEKLFAAIDAEEASATHTQPHRSTPALATASA